MIKRWLLKLLLNDQPYEELVQCHQLLIKAARRCAYDLNHAAGDLAFRAKLKEESELYSKRSSMWLNVFSPDGIKDYRHDLHREICSLECEIVRLRKLCEMNDIEHQDPNSIPF